MTDAPTYAGACRYEVTPATSTQPNHNQWVTVRFCTDRDETGTTVIGK